MGSKPTNKTKSSDDATAQTIGTKEKSRALPKPDRKVIASIDENAKATPKQKINITDRKVKS